MIYLIHLFIFKDVFFKKIMKKNHQIKSCFTVLQYITYKIGKMINKINWTSVSTLKKIVDSQLSN